MEGSNFFGVQSTSSIDDSTASFLLGDDASTIVAEPSQVSKIENEDEEDKKKKQPASKETSTEIKPEVELSEDDIFGKAPEEEPENKPTEKKKEVKGEEPEEDTTIEVDYNSLAQSLITLGVFSELEEGEEIASDEQFAEKFQKEAIKRANQEIYNILTERHGEEALKAFEAIYIHGVPPSEFFGKQAEITDLQNIDLTIQDNQEKVLREFYKRQGLSQDKIDKKIQRAIDYGVIDEESADAHELLLKDEEENLNKTIQQKEMEAKAAAMQRAQYHNNLQQILTEKLKAKEFDGIPVTEKVAKEAMDYLYTEKWKLPNGEKLTDFDKDLLELKRPENHELKVKLALLLRNKLDLSKIKITSQLNKQTTELFKGLARKQTVQKRSPSSTSPSFFDNI